MSTIQSRRRWIRLQLIAVGCLVVVLVFPSSPRTVRRAVAKAPVYQKISALVQETYVKRKIESGDEDSRLILAYLYHSDRGPHKYIVGSPEDVLRPLIEDGHLEAIRSLAMMKRESDSEQSKQLLLRAADMGDYASQMFYMKRTGFDLTNPEPYLEKLFELQNDRPGWKISFNRAFRALQDQAELGNADAEKILDFLTDKISQTEA